MKRTMVIIFGLLILITNSLGNNEKLSIKTSKCIENKIRDGIFKKIVSAPYFYYHTIKLDCFKVEDGEKYLEEGRIYSNVLDKSGIKEKDTVQKEVTLKILELLGIKNNLKDIFHLLK
jgi:hypothetical protein